MCALAAAAFFIMLDKGAFSKGAPDASDEATHADEEVVYDDDGSVKSRVYYKDGEYDGRTDYYSKDGIDYEMRYNSAGEEIASRKTEHNALGSVTVDQKRENGEITDFTMRCQQSKLTTVRALQSIGYETIAAGDSYNDLGMIKAGKAGFLFRSTDKIIADNPDIPAYETYDELLEAIKSALKN